MHFLKILFDGLSELSEDKLDEGFGFKSNQFVIGLKFWFFLILFIIGFTNLAWIFGETRSLNFSYFIFTVCWLTFRKICNFTTSTIWDRGFTRGTSNQINELLVWGGRLSQSLHLLPWNYWLLLEILENFYGVCGFLLHLHFG